MVDTKSRAVTETTKKMHKRAQWNNARCHGDNHWFVYQIFNCKIVNIIAIYFKSISYQIIYSIYIIDIQDNTLTLARSPMQVENSLGECPDWTTRSANTDAVSFFLFW